MSESVEEEKKRNEMIMIKSVASTPNIRNFSKRDLESKV
jgi:hypothetical protein